MLRPDFAAFLEARPAGARVWIAGTGRSLFPLVRSGDGLQVERCAEDALRPGDIAVFTGDGLLIAHVVDAVAPVRTSSFLGAPDARTGRILGRVVSLRRGGWVVPLPRPGRPVLAALHGAAALAWRTPAVRATLRRARDLAFSGATAPLRRAWLGALPVERLEPRHLEALLLFGGDFLRFDVRFLERQLLGRWQGEGAAVGAVGRGGRLLGFAFLDRYGEEGVPLDGLWVRSLVVAPAARGLGVGRRLLGALEALAAARGVAILSADIREENARSRRLFERAGWVRAAAEREAEANRALAPAHPPGRWVVMERAPR